jgi:hypothetical protein
MILNDHWVVLGRLQGAGVTLSTFIGQYHARELCCSRGGRSDSAR